MDYFKIGNNIGMKIRQDVNSILLLEVGSNIIQININPSTITFKIFNMIIQRLDVSF